MNDPDPPVHDRQTVVDFIHHEAELLDAGDLEAWLELFADDGVYWIPGRAGHTDPAREVSIVYDDRPRLAARVARLASGKEYAQDPVSATCHQLSNISVDSTNGDTVEVSAVQVVYEARPNTGLQIVPSRVAWRVRHSGPRLVILEKRIMLVDLDRYFENLTFVL